MIPSKISTPSTHPSNTSQPSPRLGTAGQQLHLITQYQLHSKVQRHVLALLREGKGGGGWVWSFGGGA